MEAHEATESIEHHDHGHEQGDGGFKSRAALLVSVLALVLAIASLGGSNAAKEATQENISAANAYNFYQAKSIRQTAYKVAADELEITLSKEDKLSADSKELITKKLEAYRKNIDRYESEPETGEGKKELMARAKHHQAERDLALKRDPWFDYAEATLQIGIVLASVAIITSTPLLLMGSMGLGLIGLLCTLNGFLLIV